MTIPNNPTLNEEWTNDATGVTYVWDGDRWFIKPGEVEDFVTQTEFDGKVQENQQKNDTQDNLIGALELKVGLHSTNLQNINADQITQNDDIDALEINDEAQDQLIESQGQEIESIAAANLVQDDQINVLETQIQLLAQTQAAGEWNYQRNISGSSVRPPATKTFYATHKDGVDRVLLNWADARLIMINKTDVNDTDFSFTQFEAGDKVEILSEDGSSACFGTITNPASQDAYGNMIITVERSSSGPTEGKKYLISAYRPGANGGDIDLDILDQRYATSLYVDAGDKDVKDYVDDQIAAVPSYDLSEYLQKSGGTLTGSLGFKRGNKPNNQLQISPNSNDYATNIYSFGNGQLRFRSSKDSTTNSAVGSHIIIDPNNGVPVTKIYHIPTPTKDDMAANKSYVDAAVGVPVGSIMIWLQTTPPDGWFKLHGGNFDINSNPLLHAYLQTTAGYTSGKLPNWAGRYPGEYGDHLSGTLGTFANPRTAKPNAGSPYSSDSIPNGNTRTFNGAGGTAAYSDGTARPSIDSGWDSTTRPLTVVVHYIIKHD